MKNHYGTVPLTPQATQRIQLEWDFVEQPLTRPCFLNFPCTEPRAARRDQRGFARRNESRPLAA